MRRTFTPDFIGNIRIRLLLVFAAVMLITSGGLKAQDAQRIHFDRTVITLQEAFKTIEEQSGLSIAYTASIIDITRTVTITVNDRTLFETMENLLKGSNTTFKVTDKQILLTPMHTAERVTLTGRVMDSNNNPLVGASVYTKGNAGGVTTNAEGDYILRFRDQPGTIIVYSYLGMKPMELTYAGQDNYNVVLHEDVNDIDAIIFTGFQTLRKNEMIGSVQKVEMDNLNFNGNLTLEQMLQGHISGMVVTNQSGMVGTKQSVRVRGTSTLLGNQEPVWVVDGIIQEEPLPFKATELSSIGEINEDNFDMIANFVGSAISWLNPNDIADIVVLKDASATVLYGTKAANGVIVINTKKGQKGRFAISYNGNVSISDKLSYDKLNLMNSKERIGVSRYAYEKGLLQSYDLGYVGYEGALRKYLNKEISYDEFNEEVKYLETLNTDWFDMLYRNAVNHRHGITVSGGNDKITYYTSLNASFENGTARGNDKSSYGANINLSINLTDKITLTTRLSANRSTTNGFYLGDPFQYATTTSRAIPAYNEDGSDHYFSDTQKNNNIYRYNILNEQRNSGNYNSSNSASTAINLRYRILPVLRLDMIFGLNTSTTNGETYATEFTNMIASMRAYEFNEYKPGDEKYISSQLPVGGEISRTSTSNLNYTWKTMLDYNKIFENNHNVGATVGFEVRSNQYRGISTKHYGYLHDRGRTTIMPPLQIWSTDKYVENHVYLSYRNVATDRLSNYLSAYGSFFYGYDSRYMINASIRSEASNRFGQNTKNRFLPVWSLGGRWNISNEEWMQNQKIFSSLNLHASYGWQGNVAENFGPDLIAKIPGDHSVIDNYTGEYVLEIKNLGYPDLRWEKTRSYNFGIDAGLFNDKITFGFEYYIKNTEDMIVYRELPFEYGITTMPVNGGDMFNSGWNLWASFTPVRTKDLVWSLSVNTAKNYNRIDSDLSEKTGWRQATSGYLNKKGYPVSGFWVFDFKGLDEKTGAPLFDIPSTSECPEGANDATKYMVFAGKKDPDFEGGLSTTIRYKTLTFSTSFNLRVGGKRLLYPLFSTYSKLPGGATNLYADLNDRWKEPGDHLKTDIPSLANPDTPNMVLPGAITMSPYEMYNYSTARLASATYLRCQSASLAYSFPSSITKKLNVQNLSVSLNMTNPFLIADKKYNGMDPEVRGGTQPIMRSYSIGVNISF